MTHTRRRLASPADDLFCALLVPAAIYLSSPATLAPSASLLAAVSLFVHASNYNCESSLSILGSQLSVLATGWYFETGAGQICRLALMAACLLATSRALLTRGGGSVSGGEALLTSQCVALLCCAASDSLPALLVLGSPLYLSDRVGLIHLLQTAFCCLLVFLGLVVYLPVVRSAARLHALLVLLAAAILLTTSVVINTNCLLWMVEFVTRTPERIRLLTWWATLMAGAVLFAALFGGSSGSRCSPSVVRKVFHLLACAVFVPGLLYDPELLLAASAALFFVFIVAEVVRVCDLQPWASILATGFQPFLDSKDGATLILSNIYLVLALSGVLWFEGATVSSASARDDLCLFSGVITVGIGDTVAAVAGSRLGRIQWLGSTKTLEGSVTSMVAQVLFCCVLDGTGILGIASYAWRPLCAAIAACTLAEALTAQADNLVLPPLFVIVFKLVSHWSSAGSAASWW